MALIKCPECGKEISDKAKHCINCGYPISEEDKAADNKENLKNSPSQTTYDKLIGCDYNLYKLFNEMDESYKAMISANTVTETVVKQNMVTMRSCLENMVRFMVEKTGLSDDHIMAAVKVKTGKTENINPTDIYSRITALSYYGFIPADIEKAMHKVRGFGNDAAHYTSVDDGKPNSLRGKTPMEMRNIATAMNSYLDELVDFLFENYDSFEKVAKNAKSQTVKPTNKKTVKNGAAGKKNFKALIITLVVIIVASTVAAFALEKAEENAKTQAKTTAMKTLQTHARESIAYSTKFASVKGFNADDMITKMRKLISQNPEMNYITLSKGKTKNNTDYTNALDLICYTTDASVASVTWSGNITAVAKGSCHVIIYDYSTGKYRVCLVNVN